MTRHTRNRNEDIPGAIYLNKNRYWWKVKLPGEEKMKARPLRPIGAKYATIDHSVACEVARNLWQQAVYRQNPKDIQIAVTNIASLIAAYLKHCDEYYLDENGKPTKEVQEVRYTLKPMTEVFAALGVEDFGPLRLIEVRDRMIGLDWSRKMINQRVGRIKRMFKWAVSRQLISPVVYHGLMTVEGLKRGRSAAKETPKRRPVKEKYVHAILAHTTPVVAAMIELNMLTGMRPGELVIMRPADIDRSDKAVWHYFPEKHKNQYRNIDRVISIGPRGQELLRPYMLRPETAFCFSPAESEKMRQEKLHAERTVPLKYGNRPGTNRVSRPKKKLGEVYTVSGFGHAVAHALKAANKVVTEKAAAKGKEPQLIPHWMPYQLRHTAATKVRKEMGYECAGATLGHTNMSATAIYAERNQGLADEAAKRFG